LTTAMASGNLGDAWRDAAERVGHADGKTWAALPGDIPTKRIDFCLYRSGKAGVLEPLRAVLPDTPPCNESKQSNSRVCLSDHLPLAVDFRLHPPRSTEKEEL